jgi:hypothetical protein
MLISYQNTRLGKQGQLLGLRLPDPNSLDYFCRYVKEYIYIPPIPRTVNELKEHISKTTEVNADMLHRTSYESEHTLDM